MKDIFSLDIDVQEESANQAIPDDILDTRIYDEETDLLDEEVDVSISIPGGLKETPNSKPYDAASVSIPHGTTIDAATYNKALGNLQKSFKEASDLMESLKNVHIAN